MKVDTRWAEELPCWQRAQSTWGRAMLAVVGRQVKTGKLLLKLSPEK